MMLIASIIFIVTAAITASSILIRREMERVDDMEFYDADYRGERT